MQDNQVPPYQTLLLMSIWTQNIVPKMSLYPQCGLPLGDQAVVAPIGYKKTDCQKKHSYIHHMQPH